MRLEIAKPIEVKKGTRCLSIEVIEDDNIIKINTPTPAVNSTEYNYLLEKLGSDDLPAPYPHKIVEHITHLDDKMLQKIRQDNYDGTKLKTFLSKHSSQVCLYSIQVNPLNLLVEDIHTLVQIQKDAGFKFISVFDVMGSTPEQYASRIKYIQSHTQNKIVTPYLNLCDNPIIFAEKLKKLITAGFKMIGIMYSSFLNPSNYINLSIIRMYYKQSLWFHMSGVRRIWGSSKSWSESNNVPSHLHILPYFGIDTFSVLSKKPVTGNFKKQINEIKAFDAKTSEFLDLAHYETKCGVDNHCSCFLCSKYPTKREFYEKQSLNNKQAEDSRQLYYSIRVHDAFALYNDFKAMREKMIEGKYDEYINKRPGINIMLNRINDLNKPSLPLSAF